MGEMADKIAAAIREDGGVEGSTEGGNAAPVPGTGTQQTDPPPAGAQNTDRSGPPETIPYSRFSEVNASYQRLKDYESLAEYGIEADSALRLANFEAGYIQDPKGTISELIDSQPDLTDEAKTAMKSLLAPKPSAGTQGDESPEEGAPLPKDVQDRLAYVDEIRAEREVTASQARLDTVVRHWDGQDEADKVEVPDRSKLVYIQAAAANGGHDTLEALAEDARRMYFEDQDIALGSVIQTSRDTGTPRSVPGSGAAPAPAEKFTDFKAANKQILADIAAGRLPEMEMES